MKLYVIYESRYTGSEEDWGSGTYMGIFALTDAEKTRAEVEFEKIKEKNTRDGIIHLRYYIRELSLCSYKDLGQLVGWLKKKY